MPVRIQIPVSLREETETKAFVDVEAVTVAEAIQALAADCPGLRSRLLTGDDILQEMVNVYVNEEHIRYLDGERTALNDGDVLSIVPVVAKG